MTRNDATQAQVVAARPDTSTWLGANAGSGKTRVLTDRVARLLLEGVAPEHILCLTYTKAAASEMQNRLFKRLGGWAMLSDRDLRNELVELGVEDALEVSDLAKARALFAQAIEAPGGLKVQTIHAFCAAVLRRFPLEAGVSPQFKEMEDRAAELLRARILRDMADGPEAPLLAGIARHLSDPDFEEITKALSGAREKLTPAKTPAQLRALFELPQDHGLEWIWADVFGPEDRALLARFVSVLRGQSPTMVKLAGEIDGVSLGADEPILGSFLASRLLTKTLDPSKRTPTAKTWKDLGPDEDPMRALIERLAVAARRPRIVAAYEASCDLHAFAAVFLPRYAAAKEARGWLDFDDLIFKTRDLLADERVAAWVLYRLDGGIDHILVDEAQDTSPLQWEVIEYLAQEFTSGAGARSNVPRTIFVVGDKKQSIYSFQGADPSGFDEKRESFQGKLDALHAPFQNAALEYSFRSSEAILKLVDLTFVGREAAGFPKDGQHLSFHGTMGGRVDLWPVIEPVPKPAPREWTDVVDKRDETNHDVKLATRIAEQIQRIMAEEVLPQKDEETGQWVGRPVEPKDFLILVQRRSALFAEIIRACKKAELPIAGADRLKVGAELAVRDLAALLSWLALPEDDLSLASALRSPLFGWSEQALFTLCHGRKEPFLWRTLEARQDRHPETWAMLKDLRDAADFARPYDLVERILIRHDGRGRLLSRLGPEAEDGINALLDQALAYEGAETPSLTGFLIWMQTDDLEIKRQPDSASNQIRVMTVHGAKGLEAPIVILPDCAQRKNESKGLLLSVDDTVVMKPKADAMPDALVPAREAGLERQLEERDRLLYVAMTRAENWLIVAAAGELGSNGEAWHDRVGAAMSAADAVPAIFPGIGQGLRYQSGEWPASQAVRSAESPASSETLPNWTQTPAPRVPVAQMPLSPSKLGGAKALPGSTGQDTETALAYGTAVHRWLEDLAAGLRAPDLSDAACAEAQRVLAHPDFAFLFGPNSLAEVTVSVPLTETPAPRMRGAIDRLVIEEAVVWAVDFKTNAAVPHSAETTPDGLLRQMGAYTVALRQIYPNHEIRPALLWTATPSLMVLPHDLVTEAFRTATAP